MVTYKQSGINNDLKEQASRMLYDASRATWGNRKGMLGEICSNMNDFSGTRFYDVSGLPSGTVSGGGVDGIGTKVEVAERTLNHTNMAHNLVAMCADDAIVKGAEPVVFFSQLDFKTLGKDENDNYLHLVEQIAKGYTDAANKAGLSIFSGETAELPGRVSGYGSFNYNWGGFVVWFANKKRLFTGSEIKPGDSLVGLYEPGIRSNGVSMLRKILANRFGDEWHSHQYRNEPETLGDKALTPSVIYSKPVVDMFGGWNLSKEAKCEFHGGCHVTGGGLGEKLKRVLRGTGFGADINNPFRPSRFILDLQEWGNVSDEEAYKTWNMGQGFVVISPEPQKVIEIATEYKIRSQIIGNITQNPIIRIFSRGYESLGSSKGLYLPEIKID